MGILEEVSGVAVYLSDPVVLVVLFILFVAAAGATLWFFRRFFRRAL